MVFFSPPNLLLTDNSENRHLLYSWSWGKVFSVSPLNKAPAPGLWKICSERVNFQCSESFGHKHYILSRAFSTSLAHKDFFSLVCLLVLPLVILFCREETWTNALKLSCICSPLSPIFRCYALDGFMVGCYSALYSVRNST